MKSRTWVLTLILLGFLCNPHVTDGGETHLNQIQSNPKLYLKTLVNKKDEALLTKIIQAESNWKPNAFNAKTKDHGLCQVSERYWDKELTALGLDYKNDWKDNLQGCVYILEKQGLSAWSASKHRWSKA